MADGPGPWADLSTRLLSAALLLATSVLALLGGPTVWGLFVLAVTLVMFWELAALCEPGIAGLRRVSLALAPGLLPATVALVLQLRPTPGQLEAALALGMVLPLVYGMLALRKGRLIWAGYGLMVLLGAGYLVFTYTELGLFSVVVLVTIVILSDTLGYFAGRMIGGPKFWPRVSPKKTWSGTVAGWIGAALFGGFVLGLQGSPLGFAALATLLAFAGQMGDIAESALKRRVGVKDSSNLIPGHGGFLDRLDALVAAAALAGVLTFVYVIWTP